MLAIIRLFSYPEPSDHVLHGDPVELENEGQHGQRSAFLHHCHKPQMETYSIDASRSRNVQHRCRGVKPDPRCSWKGNFKRVGVCVGMKVRSLVVLSNHTVFYCIGDLFRSLRFCCCSRMYWWVAVQCVPIDVSIWDAVHSHSIDKWALSGAALKAP